MSYIQITADFPGVRSQEMGAIARRLEQGQWKKMHEHCGTINTAWLATFPSGVSDPEAIRKAQDTFMRCCSPYCRPILVLRFLHGEPSFAATT